jgi:hypothetical protein
LEGGKKVRGQVRKSAEGEDKEMVVGGISCIIIGLSAE